VSNQEKSAGLVVLVGAGPGRADLLTLAGARWLSLADVVVYDRLVNRALLGACPADTEKVDVGKAPGQAGPDQRQINELLIRHARAGRCVVRLKGGDPLVFGRGAEEAEALAEAGVAFRIVPGVTAALACACAGIPLTDRRHASGVAFVTGHQDPAKGAGTIDWEALAGIDTVVIYMGVRNLPEIVRRLIEAGRAPQSPAAIVARAGTAAQRTVTAGLAELPAAAESAGVNPPALIVVGDVVRLRDKIAWFERLPLFGRTAIVTRPRQQAGQLTHRLAELGAAVVEAPAIEILPPDDFAPVDAALGQLGEFDLVVFTSVNGVAAFASRCRRLGIDGRALAGAKVAAIGPATADALRDCFIRADIMPDTYTTEALGRAILAAGRWAGKRILLARSDIASAALREALIEGEVGVVEDVAFYRTARPERLPEEALAALAAGTVDWITFTSPSAVANFLALLPDGGGLAGVKLAAIGPVTAEALRSADLTLTVVAREHTVEGLVRAIVEASGG